MLVRNVRASNAVSIVKYLFPRSGKGPFIALRTDLAKTAVWFERMEDIPRPEVWTAAPTERRKVGSKKKRRKRKTKRHADERDGSAAPHSNREARALATVDPNRAARSGAGADQRAQRKQATSSSASSSPRAAHPRKGLGGTQRSKAGRKKSDRGKILINGVELPDDEDESEQEQEHELGSQPARTDATGADAVDGPGPSSCDNGNAPPQQEPRQQPRRIFSLTDVALPSPVRSRVQVSISKQKAAARAAAEAKAAADQNSIAKAYGNERSTKTPTSGGSGAAAAKILRPVSAAALATALPTHTPGRQLDGRPGSSSASESANGRSGRTDTSFLNTWFSRLDQAEQTAHQHQTEASRARLTASDWEQKYEELQRKCRARDTEVHERILSLQSEILLLKNEKQSLCTDMDECHAARREDAELHARAQDKWKRREAALESARHEAMVAASLHKSRLEEQKAHTKAAIEMNKQTKDTLGAELARLRKMVQHDDKAAAAKHKIETQRLEREVARLKNEVMRVREKTKSDVAAAAAAAAAAAFSNSVNVSGNRERKVKAESQKVEKKETSCDSTTTGNRNTASSAVPSSKARLAAASQRVSELTSQLAVAEKRAAVAEEREKSARREAEMAGGFVRRKTEALQKEIEGLHAKLQERKRELEEAQEHNKQQRKQWLEVQKSVADDAKSRRELGQLVSATEKRAREACQRADRSDNALEREAEQHAQTKQTVEVRSFVVSKKKKTFSDGDSDSHY